MSLQLAFTHFPALVTGRFRLRQLQDDDTAALHAIKGDAAVTQAYAQVAHHSPADTRAWIRSVQMYYDRREALVWGITFQGADTVIGSCTFWNFSPDGLYAELGYELHRDYWQQGVMTETLSVILEYGFTALGLHRIEANTLGGNASSQRLLRKLGFTYEGCLRQRVFFQGQYADELHYGLLADEWRGKSTV
jgi:ribosomal-protein-alanine N-acetyltransferase